MKKAMIYAYTANNLGDDLFLYLLCARYPEVKFTLYAPAIYKRTFAHMHNLEVIPSDHLIQKLIRTIGKPFQRTYSYREHIAKRKDLAIYIGGSLFAEQADWEKSVQNIKSMMKHNLPFFIIGANFGPFTSAKFYNTYANIFSNCTDICFRDEQSRNIFHQFKHVRRAPDVVYGLPKMNTTKSENLILISVIYPSIRQELRGKNTMYFHSIKKIAEHCISRGYEVCLMSFCKQEKDDIAVEKIISLIPQHMQQHIQTYHYETNIKEALRVIATSRAVVASRFHAMIIGFVMQKAVYPIIYSDKMKTVLTEMEYKADYCTIERLSTLDPENVFVALHQHPVDVNKQIEDAAEHFLGLDRYVMMSDRT